MQNIGQQLGHGGLEDFRPHPALVSADAVGVELELEGFSDSDIDTARRHLQPLWTITSDGSLRNGGVEFITTGGKGGETLHQAYERITSCLRDRVNYDASWRCSTHMHINMLDFTCNQVARFVMVYAACEPVLFHLAGTLRRSSNFCTPLADSLGFHKKLIARMYDDTVSTRAGSGHTSKYTALNLQPLFGNQNVRPLGTVEFRGGRPMTTMDELLLQTNLLLSIKQFVRTFEGTEEQMLIKLNDGVFNTVYANGCASSLQSVDVNELETALIHSWLLLKSYQHGIASRREEPTLHAMQDDSLDWLRNVGERAAAAPRPAQTQAQLAWSATNPTPEDYYPLRTYTEVPDFSRTTWPRLYSRLADFCSPTMSSIEKAENMVAALRDPDFQWRLDVVSAQKVAISWLLSLNSSNMECNPIGTLVRAAKNSMMAPYGHPECLDTLSNRASQPHCVLLRVNVDYMSRLNGEQKALVAGYCEVATRQLTNRIIWNRLLHPQVGLSNMAALTTAFALRSGLSNEQTLIPPIMSSLQAFTLFRIANVQSVNHLVTARARLAYDSVVAIAEILWSLGLATPVLYTSSGSLLQRLYCTQTARAALGFSVSGLLTENHQTTPPRVSAFTGQRIY